MLVRYNPSEAARNLSVSRLDDAMAGEGLSGHVSDLRERLLASPRGAAHALSQSDERVDDERRTGQAHQREPRVVIEQQRREANECKRFAGEISERFRDRLLNLRHVIGDARHQSSARLRGKKGRRLTEDVCEEQVSEIANYALSDVGHPVAGQVRTCAFNQIQRKDRGDDLPEFLMPGEDTIENRLNQRGDPRGRGAVHDHRRRGDGKPAAIWPGVGD
jgi:hypothetical protein